MLKSIKTAALVLSILPFTAFAAPVTLQATFDSQYNKYTGIGIFTMTYDDATPADSLQGAIDPVATYLNAITSATFIFDNLSLTLNQAAVNTIQVVNNHGQIANIDARIWVSFLDTNNKEYGIGFFIADGAHPNTNTDLSNINGLQDNEGNTYLFAADDPSPYAPKSLNYIRQLSPLAPVPLPASAWLFGSCLAGLTGLSKRKK